MLDAHPRLAVTHEMHWIPKWYERRIGLTGEGLVTPDLVNMLLDYHGFTKFRFEPAAVRRMVDPEDPPTYAAFLSRIFDLYGEMQGKELVGDKSPNFVRRMSLLHELWPHTRFIHIIRDGRDVYLSMRGWRKSDSQTARGGPPPDHPGRLKDDPQGGFRYGDHVLSRFGGWEEDPVSAGGLWWKWNVLLGRADGEALGPGLYREVRYEELVADPVESSKEICSFLDIPFDKRILRFADGRTIAEGTSKQRWLPPTPGLRDWRTEMPEDAVRRFEAVTGDLLDALGYPRATSEVPPAAAARADVAARAFLEGLRTKRRPIPAGLWSHAEAGSGTAKRR
jgi:hypothetical protein